MATTPDPEGERRVKGNLAAPLWAIAAALWVIAFAAILGAMKLGQAQAGLQSEIEKLRRWPRL